MAGTSTSLFSGSRPILGFVEVAMSIEDLQAAERHGPPSTIATYPLPGGIGGSIKIDLLSENPFPNFIVTIAVEGLTEVDVLLRGEIRWEPRSMNCLDSGKSGGATSDAYLWLRGNGRLVQFSRPYIHTISGTVTVYGPSASKTLPDVSALRSLTALADVTLRVAGRDFPVHSVVLAARSPVLLTMFTSDFKEAANKVADIAVECSAEVFAVFVDSLYSGELDKRSCADLIPLLELAERYMVDGLKQECVRQLLGVGVEEALLVFRAALEQPFIPTQVGAKAGEVIRNNWKKIYRSDGWDEFAKAKAEVALSLKLMMEDRDDPSCSKE